MPRPHQRMQKWCGQLEMQPHTGREGAPHLPLRGLFLGRRLQFRRARTGHKAPQNRKYEKNTKKLQNSPPWVGPRKYGKMTKKYKMVIFGPFLFFFGNFSAFSGPNPGWGMLSFFRIFFLICGFGEFLCPVHEPDGIASRRCIPPSARASARLEEGLQAWTYADRSRGGLEVLVIGQEKGTQTQTFWSGYFPFG